YTLQSVPTRRSSALLKPDGQIVKQTSYPYIIIEHTRSRSPFQHIHDMLPIPKTPHKRRKRTDVNPICTDRNQMGSNTVKFTDQYSNIFHALRQFIRDLQHSLHPHYKSMAIVHGREVI